LAETSVVLCVIVSSGAANSVRKVVFSDDLHQVRCHNRAGVGVAEVWKSQQCFAKDVSLVNPLCVNRDIRLALRRRPYIHGNVYEAGNDLAISLRILDAHRTPYSSLPQRCFQNVSGVLERRDLSQIEVPGILATLQSSAADTCVRRRASMLSKCIDIDDAP
jgi:hypothetical protein